MWKPAPCLFVVLAIVGSPLFADERPTAEDLLSMFEKSVEKLDRARIEVDFARKSPANSPADEIRYVVLRDGPRWKIDRRSSSAGAPGRPESTTRQQTIVGDDVLQAQQSYGPGGEPGIVHLAWWRKQRDSKAYTPMTAPCLIAWGRLLGDDGHAVWTLMRDSGTLEMRPEPEIIDGHQTYMVKSRGKYGEHTLWLDPAFGGLPRRINVQKRSGNLRDDEQLGSVPEPPPGTRAKSSRPGLPAPRRTCSFRVDKVQLEKRADVFLMTRFEQVFAEELIDGQKVESKNELTTRAFDINPAKLPANSFDFDVKIPDGTLVLVIGPGDELVDERYEWFDGKVRERVGR